MVFFLTSIQWSFVNQFHKIAVKCYKNVSSVVFAFVSSVMDMLTKKLLRNGVTSYFW